MNELIHIHEVLAIIYGTNNRYTTTNLITELQQTFGDDVHFTSCADNVFPLSEVVAFLLSKNKIRLEKDVIIPLTPACSH